MQPNSSILIINGPNLNMLGTREPQIYGYDTLTDVSALCHAEASLLGYQVDFRQSNHEGEIITWIQQAKGMYCGVILNAGAFTHTSIAIMDALSILDIPIVEVHISNIFKREQFRHHSYISMVSQGVICGFGTIGYALAIRAIVNLVS